MDLKTDQTFIIGFFEFHPFKGAFQWFLLFGGPVGFHCFPVCPIEPKKEIFFQKNYVFFMELKIDQTFIIVLPFSSIFLKEFFNEFCFFWWTCWFPLFPSLPHKFKKNVCRKNDMLYDGSQNRSNSHFSVVFEFQIF